MWNDWQDSDDDSLVCDDDIHLDYALLLLNELLPEVSQDPLATFRIGKKLHSPEFAAELTYGSHHRIEVSLPAFSCRDKDIVYELMSRITSRYRLLEAVRRHSYF